ncbi:hypothetical protein PPUN109347_37020 [Pseudomonas putida]|nr:hypothetical protein PPUN109347_37020 [Pseudomonas putida]
MDDHWDESGRRRAAAACSEPECVTRARAAGFASLVTGYLYHAAIDLHLGCLVGIVYGERRGRFEDGAVIRSSRLEGGWEQDGFRLYRTVNGSIYVVCDWASVELNSRFAVFSC